MKKVLSALSLFVSRLYAYRGYVRLVILVCILLVFIHTGPLHFFVQVSHSSMVDGSSDPIGGGH